MRRAMYISDSIKEVLQLRQKDIYKGERSWLILVLLVDWKPLTSRRLCSWDGYNFQDLSVRPIRKPAMALLRVFLCLALQPPPAKLSALSMREICSGTPTVEAPYPPPRLLSATSARLAYLMHNALNNMMNNL